MSEQTNPDERFETLNLLANSQRHLLTLSDRMDRAEAAIQKAAETILALADSQKHTNEKLAGVADKLDALSDIVRSWYERHGNGSSGQHPS